MKMSARDNTAIVLVVVKLRCRHVRDFGAGRGIRTPEAHKGHRLTLQPAALKACASGSILTLIRSAIPARIALSQSLFNSLK